MRKHVCAIVDYFMQEVKQLVSVGKASSCSEAIASLCMVWCSKCMSLTSVKWPRLIYYEFCLSVEEKVSLPALARAARCILSVHSQMHELITGFSTALFIPLPQIFLTEISRSVLVNSCGRCGHANWGVEILLLDQPGVCFLPCCLQT